MDGNTIRYIFLLVALLIVVAYFAGAATDINALSGGLTKLVIALQGRTTSGAFAGYPATPGGTNVTA